MKFGKNIGRVVELSDPEWSPFWINYKFLKKKAKALEVPSLQPGVAPDQRSDPQAMAQSAGEVEFYRLLRQELKKCSDFFTSVEAQLVLRQGRVNEGWRQLLLPNIIVEGNPHKRLLAACVKLYKDLLLLENFAIMNYCGFSKILKKHDKLTGFRTRESFMRNVVNQAPFVQYPKVIKMLSAVEKLFESIEKLPSASAEAGTRVPLREEQLFIDTMLTINKDAFRLQQEEGADIGLNTPEFSHKRDGFSGKPSVIASRRPAASNGEGSSGRGGSSGVPCSGGGGSSGVPCSGRGGSSGVPCSGRGGVASSPQSSNIVGRGLDMVAAAAAQVGLRDSKDGVGAGGSPNRSPMTGAASSAAPLMAATAQVASRGCEDRLSGRGEAQGNLSAEGERAAGPAATPGSAATNGIQTPDRSRLRRGERIAAGRAAAGAHPSSSPPPSKRLRPESPRPKA